MLNQSLHQAPSGCLFIVAAPSGAGKSSLVNALLKCEPALNVSVSFTTRIPRPGEIHGVHYHFVNETRFEALRCQGEFLEYAEVHGNFYGTSNTWLATQIHAGKDVLLEIDWQGAQQIRKYFPQAIGIFIVPPSIEVLKQRLTLRGQDSEDVIARRLLNASSELAHVHEFDYLIINDVFEASLNAMQAIVHAARQRLNVQSSRHTVLLHSLGIANPKVNA